MIIFLGYCVSFCRDLVTFLCKFLLFSLYCFLFALIINRLCGGTMADQKMRSLETQVQQLQIDKMELIRSTSTEIERLRQIIRNLTDPSANKNDLDALFRCFIHCVLCLQMSKSSKALQSALYIAISNGNDLHISAGHILE